MTSPTVPELAALQPAWQIESASQNAEYFDIDCVDGSAKADLRAWRITIDCVNGAVYGVLRRSKDAEAPFDDGVDLPQKMVGLILGVIAFRTLEAERKIAAFANTPKSYCGKKR